MNNETKKQNLQFVDINLMFQCCHLVESEADSELFYVCFLAFIQIFLSVKQTEKEQMRKIKFKNYRWTFAKKKDDEHKDSESKTVCQCCSMTRLLSNHKRKQSLSNVFSSVSTVSLRHTHTHESQSYDVKVKLQILTNKQNVLNFLCSAAEQQHKDSRVCFQL